MEKTNFYQLLIKARYDEATLVSVIDKIMPMINKYSQDKNKEIDEDLKSFLINATKEDIIKYGKKDYEIMKKM